MRPVASTMGGETHFQLHLNVGVGILDVAIGVCCARRVRLGGHDPGERREGRVDVGRQMLAFFAHCVRVFWLVGKRRKKGKNGEGKRRGDWW